MAEPTCVLSRGDSNTFYKPMIFNEPNAFYVAIEPPRVLNALKNARSSQDQQKGLGKNPLVVLAVYCFVCHAEGPAAHAVAPACQT
jgi:hypothetical protein